MKAHASLLAVLLGLAPSVAFANEADTYGLGSRSSALGGAVAADVTDFSANYYNPAGLVGARGLSLSVGYVYVANKLLIDGHDNHIANVHGIVGGFVAPGSLFGIPFAFGVGTYLPDAGLSTIKALKQETPRWALYDERASILFLAANVAIRPVPFLELGGGMAFLAATQGTFGIRGTADISNPYNSKLEHQVDADLTSVRYPQLGARLLVRGFGAVGLVYRGETKLKLGIGANLAGTVELGGVRVPLTYDLETHTIDAFLPQQFDVGVSFQRVPRLHINLDVTWVNWSAYESPTAETKAHLAVDVGALPLSLPPDPKPIVIIPPLFQDRFVPRVGVEYVIPLSNASPDDPRSWELPVRAGYVYEASPVPPQTGVTNFIDADRHTFSFGLGLKIGAPSSWMRGALELDVHGQLSVLPTRVTLKDNPADFVGDYRASGTMMGLGSTLGASF